MAARICAGPRPCCDASAMMPAMSRMPVIPTNDRRKTLVSSHRIIRCRMEPNTSTSVPDRTRPQPYVFVLSARCGAELYSQKKPHAKAQRRKERQKRRKDDFSLFFLCVFAPLREVSLRPPQRFLDGIDDAGHQLLLEARVAD